MADGGCGFALWLIFWSLKALVKAFESLRVYVSILQRKQGF